MTKRKNESLASRRQLARKAAVNNLCTLRYSDFEVGLACTAFAMWAGIPVEFVSLKYIYGSALGLSFWADRARKDMMKALKKAIEHSCSLFDTLPVHLIDYMIYDAGRFDYNDMLFKRARLLKIGEHSLAHELCTKISNISRIRYTRTHDMGVYQEEHRNHA